MKTRIRSENRANYNVPMAKEDAAIIAQAIAILENRLRKPGIALTEPTAAADYCKLMLTTRESEVFGVLFLDARHRVIAYEELFYGTVDGSEVHPREVVKRSLAHNAAACIVTHNHPSGSLQFSAADKACTARLKLALNTIEVRLLDHILVAGVETLSMARTGEL